MRKLATALAMVLFAMPASAQMQPIKASEAPAGIYKNDQSHTSVTFKVMHMGLSHYTARFSKVDATIDYDPKKPENSKLNVTIDPTSVKTDYPDPAKEDFDAKIGKDPQWLNGEKFPAITFTSTSIKKTGPTTGKITGNFTMLGVTKPLVLDVTFNNAYAQHPMTKKPAMGFSATTTIKRSDWGFGTYVPMIGDEVTVLIESEFQAQ